MNEPLAGTRLLLRSALRRDRVKLVLWTVLIALFVPYFSYVLSITSSGNLQADVDDLASAQGLIGIFAGPLFGLDQVTPNRYFLLYTQEFLLAAGIMNILLVTRHTRTEEQKGRAELLYAGGLGRYAPLTVAGLMAVITNAVLAVLLMLGALSIGFRVDSAALFGIGIGITGLVFAGVTAITAQLVENARLAAGLGGVVLAAASVVRGAAAVGGNDVAALWLTPLAWAPLTRVLVAERWWPLLVPVLAVVGCFAVAYVLSTRRDVGAGFVSPRSGRVRAGNWLGSPAAIAWRLQRAGLGWWMVAMAVLGLAWGSLAGALQSGLGGELIAGDNVVVSYLSLCLVTMAFLAGVMVLLAVNRIRVEETSGRLESVLATASGRASWLASWLGVITGMAVALLLVIGTAVGFGAAVSTGDPGLIAAGMLSGVGRAPELLLLMAIAALLYAFTPRLVPLAWIVIGYGMIARFFGESLAWPEPVLALSIFHHIPRMPYDTFTAVPGVVLLGAAGALAGLALLFFRRRDV